MAAKMGGNGSITGNSVNMHTEYWAILDQNFGKSPSYLFLIFSYNSTVLKEIKAKK